MGIRKTGSQRSLGMGICVPLPRVLICVVYIEFVHGEYLLGWGTPGSLITWTL